MKIGVVPNLSKENASLVLEKVICKLSTLEVQYELLQYSIFDALVSNKTGEIGKFFKANDVIIAIGGDGTIIHTAKIAAVYAKPVLGINSGRIGYMAALEADEIDLLDKLVNGDYDIEKRMMLKTVVSSDPEKVYYSLNDTVVSRDSVDYALDLILSNCDKQFMKLRADGLIVSTPTGSTAYAMSAGGPVTDPSIECMIAVPICPISLYSKGFVLSAESVMKISFKSINERKAYVTFDGRNGICLSDNDTVTISRADDVVTRLVKIKNDSFYDVLKNKISAI